MRRPPFLSVYDSIPRCSKYCTKAFKQPIISIDNGTFYRQYPSPGAPKSSSNPPLFPGLTFTLPSYPDEQEHWAVIGPSNAGKTTLLEILRGKHVSLPPTSRSFPYLASEEVEVHLRNASRAIQYVGFDGERGGVGKSGTRGAYMSARYESRREDTDFSVLEYLKGNTELNPIGGHEGVSTDMHSLDKVIEDLRLKQLLSMPMGNLSNGQTRRARIARALLGKPLVLLLDEPFMGLDPPTTTALSPLLHSLAKAASPRLVLALRPQDPLPDWITHVAQLGPSLRIAYQGVRNDASLPTAKSSRSPVPTSETSPPRSGGRGIQMHEKVVEMKDVHVRYGEREVLGNWEVQLPSENTGQASGTREGLWWDVKRGERWGVFGPNGSGKTTLISLICSDHPLSYSLPIKIFGRNRLPQLGKPGISIFDIQARIGQSSPEIHAFFPRNLLLRQVIENAWADTFLGTPRLTSENKVTVDACLRWFEAELNPAYDPYSAEAVLSSQAETPIVRRTNWADSLRFGEAPFSAQRVALFLRALVKKPEMVVLDEAFSGMDEHVREKCMLFLACGETQSVVSQGEELGNRCFTAPTAMHGGHVFAGLRDDQTLICVSHVKEEVPKSLEKWMCLPDAGTGRPARFGHFKKPLDEDPSQWKEIWEI